MGLFMLPLVYASHRQASLRDDSCVFVIYYRHSLDPGMFAAYRKFFQPISPSIGGAWLLLVSFVAAMHHHFSNPRLGLCDCGLEGFLLSEWACLLLFLELLTSSKYGVQDAEFYPCHSWLFVVIHLLGLPSYVHGETYRFFHLSPFFFVRFIVRHHLPYIEVLAALRLAALRLVSLG